jgi:serine/threonine protein kinase
MAEPASPSSLASDATPADASDARIGTSLGKYRILRRLGKGGMGLVYEAFDTLLKRQIAIKVLSDAVAEQQDAMRRFLMEARAAGRLNHPNIVAIYDVEHPDSTYFIVMELVRGGSAQEFLDRRGPFDWPEATQVVADVCRGLAAAHAAGLIHRDLKPSNIMRSAEGVVKLADFGLAKITTSQSSIVPVTATGYTVGTPDFMSPEQCRAETIDARSDLYSLGATYYTLLTGKPPFQGGGPLQVMFAHCSNVVPDPRVLNKAIHERCTTIIHRAMAKFPNERYGDATEMLAELEEVLALVPKEAVVPATQWTHALLEPLTPEGQSSQTALVPPEVSDLLAPPQKPGEIGRLGPYRVLKILGEGGMGMVFQAEDPGLERLVALKVLKPDKTGDNVARQRFVQEAKVAAKVQHENIVTIYQVGEDRNIPYLAMQFLHGESLDERLRRERKLPIAGVVRIGREMAEALEAAHQSGLIHRDIKPPNIWLEAPSDRVKILDFGLARSVTGGSQQLTRTGLVMGTPGYMAPEQARSNQPLDHRCDLFSLGCVLYHMTTGQEPFRRDDAMATLLALALEEPPLLTELRPDAPPALVVLIQQLLAKSPIRRPATARLVSAALRDLERYGAPAAVQASVPVGGGVAPAKLTAYGLSPSEAVPGGVLPPSRAALPTPPSGQPRTTVVEGLPPLPEGPAHTGIPEEEKKPTRLVWLYVLLAGLVAIIGAAVFAAVRH